MPTTWTSQDLWVCEDCGAVLGVAKIKVKSLKVDPTLRELTKDAFCEESEQ